MGIRKFIKSRLNERQFFLLKKFKIKIDILMRSISLYFSAFFSKNRVLSSVYYCLCSNKFSRENRAVLLGRVNYYKESNQPGSSSLLRRNIHRLEKGLIMQPRRNVFAEAYISETVDEFLSVYDSGEVCAEELKWAADVLIEFFDVCGSSMNVDSSRERFFKTCKFASSDENLFVPYAKSLSRKSNVSYEQLEALFMQRRSVRWYLEEKVDKKLIGRAVNIAKFAPSACNRQSFRFYLATSKEKSVQIAKCAMGTVGFADNINCMVAIIGDLSAYPEARDRHVIYVDAALAGMQLMLALETLGLSSCPINWPDIEENEKKLSKILGLSAWERPVMLLSIGYADPSGMIPFSQKKSNKYLIKELD